MHKILVNCRPCAGIYARKASPGYPGARRGARTAMSAAETSGAFIDASLRIEGASEGLLKGLTFAVKDMYDIEGHQTGFGNPTWRKTHDTGTSTAPAIQALLDAGATLTGKAHMDELAYSLNGENIHFGTPVNPACPDRIPGGSSSGSAVAVASGIVDFAIGSDTAGSVRVPASYCGILGMRPSHGRVSLEGARPLAHSFDTGGWFARDPAILRKVGSVLLQQPAEPSFELKRWLVAKDAFSNCLEATEHAFYEKVSSQKGAMSAALGEPTEIEIGPVNDTITRLDDWVTPFLTVQAKEVWEAHGEWITTARPEFGPGIKERFENASKITPEQSAENAKIRLVVTEHINKVLGSDGVLMVPSAPGSAPMKGIPPKEPDEFRRKLILLTGIAALNYLPQISIPCVKVDGCPVGLGIIGPRGSDEALLRLAEKLAPMLAP